MKTALRRVPFWPVILGALITLAGVAGGYLLPVGEFCAATFLPQTAARDQDNLHANGSTLTTHYQAACAAAASQQSAIWWGLIYLGAAVLAVGLAWRFVPLAPEVRPLLRSGLRVLWGGVGLLFVGAVGGWAVPVGKDCSGAFGNQAPAAIVKARTGSSAELDACHAAAALMSPIWGGVAILGGVVITAALALLAIQAVNIVRQRLLVSAIKPAGWRDVWTNGPRWPLVLGFGVIAAALLCGFSIPVGPYCSGAFTPQNSAMGQDFFEAMTSNRMTDFQATCAASAAQQSVIWWVLIALGVGLVVAAFILRRRFLEQVAAGHFPAAPAPVPAAAFSAAFSAAVAQPAPPMPARPPAPAAPLTTASATPISIAGELGKLAELRDRGVLTQEEFEQQKARLLAL